VVTKLWYVTKHIGFLVLAVGLLALSGCGGGSTGNTVTVAVTPATDVLIVSQSVTFTATVSGATNLNVTWGCSYTTTTVSGTTTTTSAAAECTAANGDVGALSDQQNTTVTYTAPTKVPDPTKYHGLIITITATSAQDTTKTGTAQVAIDSGISVVLTPNTATVPTKEQQQFSVTLTNDIDPDHKGVTWLVTQGTPTSTVPYPSLTSCSPACGTVDATGKYTAPDTVPTTATVTLVAAAVADNTRFALGSITIITGGPITFYGISPINAPQGATFWDIYLDAPNISSASVITLTGSGGGTTVLTSGSGQIKVLFPIPTSTVTNPPSTGARIRLIADNLKSVDSFTISVSDPGQPVTKAPTGVFTYNVVPIRPSLNSSTPDSVIQGTITNATNVAVDGGYFGPTGTLATVQFQGNPVPQSSNTASTSRQLNVALAPSSVDAVPPGLYPLSVTRTTPPLPNPNVPAVSNIAVFPDYSTIKPTISQTLVAPGTTNLGAIDIDTQLGVVVVAQTTSNSVQFYSVGAGSLTPINGPVTVGNLPTGLSVNRTNHTVAVVNYGDQSVTVLPIPTAPVAPGTPFTISLAGLFPATPTPSPYAIGVDPDTNMALVAYSSSTISVPANVGFLLNLNTDDSNPYHCLGNPDSPKSKCVYAQVSLSTGTYPQIAMAPHGHLAFVTPGGLGVIQGIDVTKPSTSVAIASVSLTSGAATVTTSTPHNLNPGNPGTVLISGVASAAGSPTFNGAFTVISVLNQTQFIYALNSTTNGTGTGGTASYSAPNFLYGGVSQTAQGIAINPITNTAAIADANATGANGSPEIDLLSALDQSVSSITFFANCTAFDTSCSNAPDLIGTTNVAWQPYTNSVVSYNPKAGQPKGQLSISNPVTRQRYAFLDLSGPGGASITVTNGGTNLLTLWGGVAVDPVTNQAFVVESGTTGASAVPGRIDVVNLYGSSSTDFNLKAAEISEILVPSPTPGPGLIGGIPNALVPQGTLTSANDLAGVQIFGSGFAAGAQVRLDGTAIPGANVQVVSARKIVATIPNSFLTAPHRFALDVLSGGVQSNATAFLVLRAIDMTPVCTSGPPQPSSVGIADQLGAGAFSPIAVVSNSGCNSISIIDINPASATFGAIKKTIGVGTTPQGLAVSPRYAMAVVANNAAGTVSVIDLIKQAAAVADVATGTKPIGVAINDTTGAVLVTNFGSNTISEINLSLLFGATPATTLTATSIGGLQQPIAVAIDPDRGTNNQGIGVVTSLQLISGSAPFGALQVVDIGLAAPALSTTSTTGTVNSTPTGLVFNPVTDLFYANASGANSISSFNPDTGSTSTATVGINPTGLALNPQTGSLLTSNVVGKSVSIVDITSNPLKTRQTIGIPGSPQFGVAIDQFTNLAVIVDQANNRLLLFPMP